ncbi:FAS1-like dehydratase domain-containing protein [Tsukamurella soli]|uniref:FAS1-like dehydratase domain-containing protein n=1 Tax=Tsukamurella soli TaxID=644556 RepID=UPI0031E58F88
MSEFRNATCATGADTAEPCSCGIDWDVWYPDMFEISGDLVRMYARAIGASYVPYLNRSVIPADTPVPGTIVAAPMLDTLAPVVSAAIPNCNVSRIVHAGQRFEYLAPLRIGDRVSLGAKLLSHVVKAGVDIVAIEVTAFAGDQAKVIGVMTVAHSTSGVEGLDPAALDMLADNVMLAGTGPSASDAYSGLA